VSVDGAPDESSLAALETLPLCARYAAMPAEELAVLHSTIIAQAP
jgi:hypothetical protein